MCSTAYGRTSTLLFLILQKFEAVDPAFRASDYLTAAGEKELRGVGRDLRSAGRDRPVGGRDEGVAGAREGSGRRGLAGTRKLRLVSLMTIALAGRGYSRTTALIAS